MAGRERTAAAAAASSEAVVDAEVEDHPVRHVAAGGWRRALVGLVLGVLAGAAIGLLVPRDREHRTEAVVPTRSA